MWVRQVKAGETRLLFFLLFLLLSREVLLR